MYCTLKALNNETLYPGMLSAFIKSYEGGHDRSTPCLQRTDQVPFAEMEHVLLHPPTSIPEGILPGDSKSKQI